MSETNMILVGLTVDADEIKEAQDKKIVEIRFGKMRWGCFEADQIEKQASGYSYEELQQKMRQMQCPYGFELIYDTGAVDVTSETVETCETLETVDEVNCSRCTKTDKHGGNCYSECNFCDAPICYECWYRGDSKYSPAMFCPDCEKKISECPKCVAYFEIDMGKVLQSPICEEHMGE